MEFTPRAAELTTLLENLIARVYGLNEIQAGEMVEFACGVKGIAFPFVGGNFFMDCQMLGMAAYVVYFVFLIKDFIIISEMNTPSIPDLNTTLPGSSDPASSSQNDPEKEKKIRRCRSLIRKWIQNFCLQICVGRGVCRPKCISQMSPADQEDLIDSIWRGFQFDENPSSRRIDYVWRKARDLTPSEIENHPITQAWKGQWNWDDL